MFDPEAASERIRHRGPSGPGGSRLLDLGLRRACRAE